MNQTTQIFIFASIALAMFAYVVFADRNYRRAEVAMRTRTDTPLAEHAIDACAHEYVVCIRILGYTSQSARSHVRAYLASTYGEQFTPCARRTLQRHAIVAARRKLTRCGIAN